MISKFDDIRPYYDSEINEAMCRIARSEMFPVLANYVYPDCDVEDVRAYIRSLASIRQFQLQVMYDVNRQVIGRSIKNLTVQGIENISPSKRYLFVSNHRDIVLDSCLLQYVLHTHGHETSEISFGSNLMSNPDIVDIGKSNKMFRVERGGSMKEFYLASLHLSEYIRYAITEKHESVWIAQRNGRTKDGNDRTEPGLIKMFASSLPSDPVKALGELNIVPVSISYEWETCDSLKANEVYVSQTAKYVKKDGEDLRSIIRGILDYKGNVNICVCRPLREKDLQVIASGPRRDFFKNVSALIDKRITGGYKLHPTNFVAYDILHSCSQFKNYYDDTLKKEFLQRIKDSGCADNPGLRDVFLRIYANPVISRFHPTASATDNE